MGDSLSRSRITEDRSLLKLDGLCCGYGEEEIVKGISFSVKEGAFLGVLGPNGAGKTTLFRAITGIVKSSAGTILYRGRNMDDMSRSDVAREIAVLPQSFEMPFSFTVEEFVSMGRFSHLRRFERFRERDMEVVAKAMELADIAPLCKRKVCELSGGERQRAMLAQCFAQEPTLLLLDEPTTHLDIGHQVYILDLLVKMNRQEGLTVMMVMHDLNLAASYCDELMLLKDGGVFRYGDPSDVLTFENIEELYSTVVVVEKNPVTSRPHVYLVPGKQRTALSKRRPQDPVRI